MHKELPGNPTLYSLQLLRFIAALFVLLFHLELMGSGYKGVDIFFVISGFVMYYTTVIAGHKSGKTFIIHRLTKIYILYWLVLLAFYFVHPYKFDINFFEAALLLPGHALILNISWSLSYELYFYFLFGAVVFLLRRKYHKPIFIVLLSIASFITVLNTTSYTIRGLLLNFLAGQNLWEFLLGILCCAMVNTYKVSGTIAGLCAIICLAAIAAIPFAYAAPASYMVYGGLACMLVGFAVWYEKAAVLPKRLLLFIKTAGDASYAIYLTGPVIVDVLMPVSIVSKMFTLALVITVSVVVNKCVENRLLKVARRSIR